MTIFWFGNLIDQIGTSQQSDRIIASKLWSKGMCDGMRMEVGWYGYCWYIHIEHVQGPEIVFCAMEFDEQWGRGLALRRCEGLHCNIETWCNTSMIIWGWWFVLKTRTGAVLCWMGWKVWCKKLAASFLASAFVYWIWQVGSLAGGDGWMVGFAPVFFQNVVLGFGMVAELYDSLG